ncbi:MAG: ribonuclease P protein component [Lachnospiraceae bacterium]|nr:ribonuclease P protein component [Lachnospiraceae bacterium]
MKYSIKKNSDFKKIYEEKNSFATKNIIMYISKNSDMESNRLGISVSHKVGNSVVRHTLSRRIREIFRKNVDQIEQGIDMVIVLRAGSDKVEFFKLNEDFLKLCKKHGILR